MERRCITECNRDILYIVIVVKAELKKLKFSLSLSFVVCGVVGVIHTFRTAIFWYFLYCKITANLSRNKRIKGGIRSCLIIAISMTFLLNAIIYPFAPQIASIFNKEGVCCINHWNNTEWFIPNDKSFSYGFDPNLQKGID